MLKKCWITSINAHLTSITFESEEPAREEKRLSSQTMLFPERPTPENPLRHVITDIVLGIEKFQDKKQPVTDLDTSLRMQKLMVNLLQKINDYKLARDTSGEFSQVVQKNNEIRLGSDIEESFSELILEIMLLAKKTKEDIDVGEALRNNLMNR